MGLMLLSLPMLSMQEMLDPTVGEGVVAAMKREVHRMELRHAELLRTQERLMQVGRWALLRNTTWGCSTGAAAQPAWPAATSFADFARHCALIAVTACSVRTTSKVTCWMACRIGQPREKVFLPAAEQLTS